MNEEEKGGAIVAAALAIILALCMASALSRCDTSTPILSERNPNGTIDYWYIGRNAE